MKAVHFCFLAMSFGAVSSPAWAAAPVVERGTLPQYSYPELSERIAQIWTYVQKETGLTRELEAPIVYIAPFRFEGESADWIQWRKDWVQKNPAIWDDWRRANPRREPAPDENPFPPHFFAFHYDGTNRIQVNPDRTFLPFFVNGPDGMRRDYTGFGYYSVGHELHHYALESLGIPGPLHHCIFLQARSGGRKPLMDTMAVHLVEAGIIASTVYYSGLRPEYLMGPCERLSPEERAQALEWAGRL